MNHSKMPGFPFQYQADLPYPKIRAAGRNPEYARMILSNIGSGNSEMTAVSLYFYNSVVLESDYREFADYFHEISIVEMRHLDIFAALALQLGADPRLWSVQNGRRIYWTPSHNRYPREIKALLHNSMEGEKAAIRKYTKQAEIIRDANIEANLQRIILDEEHHLEIFQYMLEQIA